MADSIDKNSVFINVPYDDRYEPLFIALIAAVVSVGRTPRCVLEVQERGQGRLRRIVSLLRECAISIHDLSRVGRPARFNMPFELGLACGLQVLKPPHAYVLFEKVDRRLNRTLSDLSGRDAYIHGGRVRRIIACTLEALRTTTSSPDPEQVFRLYRATRTVASELRRVYDAPNIFTGLIFVQTVTAAIEFAAEAGMIPRGE